jgi:hypothetical protein
LFKEEEIVIGLLNAKTEKLKEKAKELHAAAEARADVNFKMQEDLNK